VHFQSTPTALTSSEITAIALAIICYAAPIICFAILCLKRESWSRDLVQWRRNAWMTGFVLGFTSSFAGPFFLAGIQFLSSKAKDAWFINDWSGVILAAFVISPLAAVLLGFGKGKMRWLGMLAASLTCFEFYVTILAMSD
jgi:hypothetical protein